MNTLLASVPHNSGYPLIAIVCGVILLEALAPVQRYEPKPAVHFLVDLVQRCGEARGSLWRILLLG